MSEKPEHDPRLNRECFDCGATREQLLACGRVGASLLITEAVRVPLIVDGKLQKDKSKNIIEALKPWTLCAVCWSKAGQARIDQRQGEEFDRRAKAAREAAEAERDAKERN